MDTSEVHVGLLTCMRLERGTLFTRLDKPSLNRLEQAALPATTMLCDAHNLGACCEVVVQWSISGLHETEAKQSLFPSVKTRLLDLSLQPRG